MKVNTTLAVIIALIIGVIGGWYFGASQRVNNAALPASQVTPVPVGSSTKAAQLKTDMRKLWEDHIIWTRMYIVSTAYNNPDTNNAAARLLKNQEDIGNAIKPYYGEGAGDQLTTLLKEHINGAVAIIKAAKDNDQAALSSANDNWYKNGSAIADFLSQANPNWPNSQTREMMKEHLDLTKQEAVDVLGNKYDAGITDYDKVHDQILRMADTLSDGIIKQFPQKF